MKIPFTKRKAWHGANYRWQAMAFYAAALVYFYLAYIHRDESGGGVCSLLLVFGAVHIVAAVGVATDSYRKDKP